METKDNKILSENDTNDFLEVGSEPLRGLQLFGNNYGQVWVLSSYDYTRDANNCFEPFLHLMLKQVKTNAIILF